jgi:hypothetical protein
VYGITLQFAAGNPSCTAQERRGMDRKTGVEHEFATARVKSASQSRDASTSFQHIVDTKHDLLTGAIQSLEPAQRSQLASKGESEFKLQEQKRRALRAEIAQLQLRSGVQAAAIGHAFATQRLKAVVRARQASEELQQKVTCL